MKKTIRTGVVGVGSLGQHHARKYALIPDAELTGVFDVNREQAEALANELGCTAFDDLTAFAEAVDATSVAVPTDLHRKIAGELLEAGIHLLVEKPIASTTAEAEELVELAQSANLILQVGHIERFNPVLSALDNLESAPKFIEATRLAPYPPPRDGALPRGTEVSVVLDLMIHDIEIILHLVKSPIKEIRAVGVPVLSPSEDISNVRLSFENGCVADITASRISADRLRKIRLFFDHAYVSLDYQEQTGEIQRVGPTGILREEIGIIPGDALERELASFVDCVKHHNEPLVTGERASEALRLATQITRIMREGGC